VEPEGFTLDFVEVDPLFRAFRSMVRNLEYDVCELAITTYLCAKEHGKRAGVPALVAEAAVMEAHGLALVKDTKGCLAALHESERAFAAAADRDRPDWLRYFDRAYLAAKFGRCFRDLGRPVEAERFARRSLDMIDGYDRSRLFNLILLASILADQRKVDEACQVGSAALCIARNVRSVRTSTDLAELSRRLAPFRADPAVRTLTEQMRTAGLLVQRTNGRGVPAHAGGRSGCQPR